LEASTIGQHTAAPVPFQSLHTFLLAPFPALQIDGGDPMLLNGNVALCVRSDDPSGRHFDGTLAYLGLYDVALNDTQVE
jgi:hypothetical protein